MYAQNDCILLLNAISKYHIIVLWSLLYYSLFESYLRKWHELNTNIYFIILTGCNISRWNISDVERGFWESRFNWVMHFYNLNCHYNCHWNLLEINLIIFELHLTDTISMLTFWTFTPTRVHFIALTSSILNTILVVRVGSGRYFWSRIISFKVIFFVGMTHLNSSQVTTMRLLLTTANVAQIRWRVSSTSKMPWYWEAFSECSLYQYHGILGCIVSVDNHHFLFLCVTFLSRYRLVKIMLLVFMRWIKWCQWLFPFLVNVK
jgi:hypothetical protein